MDIEYFINNWKNIKEEDISFTTNDWIEISLYQYLSEAFIEKYKEKVNWGHISIRQKLSEAFIEKHEDKVDWSFISVYQSLSEEFIEKHKYEVSWYSISEHQFLSEGFIEKYKDKVNWHCISISQSLSEQFIYKYKDKISHPNCLNRYYRLRCVKYNNGLISFSIHTNNSYGLIIDWKNGINMQNIPSNIIFCHTL